MDYLTKVMENARQFSQA
jgi:glutaryl-CoA dehydrogenase